jgi:hypothetical protein
MKMKHWKVLPLAAALAVGGCMEGSDPEAAAADDGGAWMEGATVTVARDAGAGREAVTLTDPASGFSQVMSDEPLVPGAVETEDDPSPMEAALEAGRSS